ncbi:MAG: CARDB domain-containing protein [Patescibacteria group bacterium]
MNNQVPNNLPTEYETSSKNTVKVGYSNVSKKRVSDIFTQILSPFKDIFSIIGIIVVILFVAYGATFVAKYAATGIKKIAASVSLSTSNVFTSEEVIPDVSSEKVVVGKAFTLSWNHLKKAEGGSYSLNYPCVDGLYLTIDTVDSGKKTALCNKDFEFVNNNNELVITPTSAEFSRVELPITLKFTRNGENKPYLNSVIKVDIVNPAIKDTSPSEEAKEPTKTETIVINTPAPVTQTTTPVPGQTTSNVYTIGGTSPTTENPNGRADLRPTFLDIGYLDSNNNFVSTTSPIRSNRVAVKFKIENTGDKSSNSYRFNAYLPTFPGQIFNSDEQIGLAPGNRVEYTIAFDRALQGNQNFRILVDGSDNVLESNENNNDVSTTINIQ